MSTTRFATSIVQLRQCGQQEQTTRRCGDEERACAHPLEAVAKAPIIIATAPTTWAMIGREVSPRRPAASTTAARSQAVSPPKPLLVTAVTNVPALTMAAVRRGVPGPDGHAPTRAVRS